jgi:hypothetical protein
VVCEHAFRTVDSSSTSRPPRQKARSSTSCSTTKATTSTQPNAERAERNHAIDRAWQQALAGQGRPASEVLDDLRRGR